MDIAQNMGEFQKWANISFVADHQTEIGRKA